MSARNRGTELDLSWISKIQVNQPAVLRRAEQIQARRTVKKEWQGTCGQHSLQCILTKDVLCITGLKGIQSSFHKNGIGLKRTTTKLETLLKSLIPDPKAGGCWLLKAVTFIDLTTLSGDDTSSNVQRLCYKAKYPIREDLLKSLNMHDKGLTTAAVCVYPARVCDAVKALKASGCTIPVASVATGFPAGQTHLKTRLEEIRLAVEDGATEIDVVINRTLVLTGQWEALYDEIRQFRKACGEAHLKTILATGELGSLTNVYKASMIAMMAGSDFIKTSTGKETVNATFPVAIVMLRAIRDFFWKTGNKVGFKPAGGIRNAKDSLAWLSLVKEELGDEWLTPELFRIGASTLLSDIERQIYHHVTGRYAAYHDLPMS
uniref:deoxyribose-phosphate aldolase n=1 Tax=Halichoerus grypus TaxID=9711 RepID=UPI001658CB06|nr:deoxyribose-phosphate aldolase [Halichoerus grypus]